MLYLQEQLNFVMSKLLISIISYLALLLLALVPEWQTSKAERSLQIQSIKEEGRLHVNPL